MKSPPNMKIYEKLYHGLACPENTSDFRNTIQFEILPPGGYDFLINLVNVGMNEDGRGILQHFYELVK